MAYQGLAGLYRDFFGVPHMFAVVKLLGSRSLPAIIRALLDHISSKVSSKEHCIVLYTRRHKIQTTQFNG
jgi:cytoplasmic FMR1 interacting protein